MTTSPIEASSEQVQAVAELFQTAAQELLLAYQRNKEATRHHNSGAFRAALHHARMSCAHSSAAHDCLMRALEKSGQLSAPSAVIGSASIGRSVRRDH